MNRAINLLTSECCSETSQSGYPPLNEKEKIYPFHEKGIGIKEVSLETLTKELVEQIKLMNIISVAQSTNKISAKNYRLISEKLGVDL